ncbi:hypothetical protein [Bradyrhizobium sp. SZCCHNRI3043]|uniref:hypothetical protein n=1 Tax=Bradyrhizobium sp. SZCCHNRI3043 TaxID=3057292 RepID=UPI0028E3FF9C|nr:hypothetical protein [Bradyrhizobium sp. SZCCHNRI3043]
MRHRSAVSKVNPRPPFLVLCNGIEIGISDGLTCPPPCCCDIRPIDAEAIGCGFRIICRACHRVVLHYEPVR